MEIVKLLVTGIISSIVVPPVLAYTMSRYWAWFVASTFDVYPSMGAWYGIALCGDLIVSFAVASRFPSSKDDEKPNPWRALSLRIFTVVVGSALLLVVAHVVGSITGWKS